MAEDGILSGGSGGGYFAVDGAGGASVSEADELGVEEVLVCDGCE